MKRATAAAAFLLLLFIVSASYCLESPDFDAVVDFSVTIKTLSGLDETAAKAYGLMDRFLLLDGTVTNLLVLDPKKDSYTVQLELVSGEWIGLEEVRSYSCWVLFSGPQFAAVFPRRVPRKPPPGIVANNSHILVVARALQKVEVAEGQSAWVLEGVHVRRLR